MSKIFKEVFCVAYIDETTPETKCISGKRIRVFWKAMENDRLVDHSLLHLLVEIIIKHLSIPASKEVSSDEQYANYQVRVISSSTCLFLPVRKCQVMSSMLTIR